MNQGELSAIQDAQTLNDLLLQKVNLAKQYAQQEFALRNSDAIERSASPAVNAAIAYQQQKATNDAAMAALLQQITYQQQRVSIEKQVFDLATSTYDLQAQANALNLTSLREQVQQWKDMQTVIKSIVEGANGLYTFNPASLSGPSPETTKPATTVQVANLNLTLPNVVNGKDFTNELANELRLRGRFGYGTQFTS